MELLKLETLASQSLLGIRFWDRLAGSSIAAGLQVTAQRLSDDLARRVGRPTTGRPTPAGVFVFFGLAAEEKVGPDPREQIWATTPPSHHVVVDVEDSLGRYLPMSFVARFPFRGMFKGVGDWLNSPLIRPIPNKGDEMGVYLWPASRRPVPLGCAIIYAHLVVGDGHNPPPAAYALVKVTQPGSQPTKPFTYFGMADAEGKLSLPLPYPPVIASASGSYPSLKEQTFAVRIMIQYKSDDQATLPGSSIPNLKTLLDQALARIGTHWSTDTPPKLKTGQTLDLKLKYGRPLILSTAIGSLNADKKESVLRIQQ